eukprot:3719838-Amphidinium_carterae.1
MLGLYLTQRRPRHSCRRLSTLERASTGLGPQGQPVAPRRSPSSKSETPQATPHPVKLRNRCTIEIH